MARPFFAQVNAGNNYKPIIFRRDDDSYVLFFMAVSFEGKCAVAFRANPAFGIINSSVPKDFFYFLFCNMPAIHPAFYMFGKNQMADISKRFATLIFIFKP